jgi:hypothetical protein
MGVNELVVGPVGTLLARASGPKLGWVSIVPPARCAQAHLAGIEKGVSGD